MFMKKIMRSFQKIIDFIADLLLRAAITVQQNYVQNDVLFTHILM